ncbi:MAG TPA: DUF3185 family protein [Opitutaceae bacterium]|nr:DUF3185 family protein [Opitutaceae bacterium]
MKKLLGIVLIVGGGWLVYTGYNRSESIAGKTEEGLADLKNEIDGKARVADHVWYYAGGALLIVVGGAMVMRKG